MSSSSLWIKGVIVNVNKEKHCGFIQPQTELPAPFVNRDVHFTLHKVSWNVQENDRVEFQLDKRQQYKPTAFAVKLQEPHSIASSNGGSSFQLEVIPKRVRTMICDKRCQGKVAKIQDTFGFIQYDTIKPSLAALSGDLYFSVGSSHSGHFKLDKGDQVSFYVCENPKLNAFDVRLVQCGLRTVEVIENYIVSLLEKIADSGNVASREHVIVAVTCLPVWKCIGHASNITDNGLRMLVELLIQLNEKEFLKENAAVVLETLHDTPLFAPNRGRLFCYMNDLVTQHLTNELLKLHHLIILMAQRVPKCGRQITEFIKPLISAEPGSCEKLLYQLLRQFTKGTAGAIDNMQWNELPLVPSVDELVSGKLESYSSLDRVIEKGAYPSTESYVDTYFRLLRIDCFSAMAKGVTDLINGKLDSRDMNVYRGIRLAGVQLTHSGSCSGLSIGLAVVPHQKVNWDQSSNLMFGNLLCISVSGTFQDPMWATVASRDLLQKHHIVVVELCCEANSHSNSESLLALYFAGPSSVMVESPTYYRAYQPVLRALQNTDTEQLAFKDELVKCQQGTCPEYITAETELNADVIYMQIPQPKLNALCYSLDESSLGLTTLDASQVTAIKQCLKNRVAIIQGPPGTGKTFVGMKIVELLLSVSMPLRLPILILTYKNHSLDEFLKEMIKLVPHSVARVGGRSQEKALSSCTLNELRRSKEYRFSEPVFKEIKFFKSEMDRLKQEIHDVFNSMEEHQHLSVDLLLQFFAHEQLSAFLLRCNWSKTKQKPFKSDDDSKWQKVSKTITNQEVSQLVESCGKSSVQKLVEDSMNGKYSIGAKLYQLLKSALSLWLPKVEDFQAFERNVAMSQGSVLGRYEQLANPDKSGNNDWLSAERDTDEIVQERLAARLAKQTSADKLFKDFKMFGSSQDRKGHLLKIAQVVVEKSAAGSLTGVRNLWDLNINDRILLIQYLLLQKFAEDRKYFEGLLTEYEKTYRTKEELEDQQKVNILQRMKIVGMTVTGANIHRDLIAQIRPEVILVEEAAEVLEPQLVALMGDWVKHLIMIGHHKQLRPAVENYTLARDYHLDLSMMERLINNGLSYATLTMQNRMRPEFAELLLDIYPKLQSNLARVESNKPANCIGRSMYFWTHEEPETKERSFINGAEAERAVRLALFLVDQGYRPTQITILSPYLGQVRLIRRMVKAAEKEFKDLFVAEEIQTDSNAEGDVPPATDNCIKVHTVDLYQGDENDFVIISLVRSNDRGNVGFLSVLNRRCVAQSRAQCGLYFIGNRQTLSRNKDWNVLIEELAKSHCVDMTMPLHCPFHPTETRLLVSSHDQIPVKQSFCSVSCGYHMPCRHVCKKTCQPRHSHILCRERVTFTFSKCGHSQERECHEDEEKMICNAKVSFYFTPCNHLGYRKCYQKDEDVTCSEKCTKILKCSHPCEMKCGERCNDSSCSVCQKIREAEEEKRRQAEEKRRAEIREEAKQRIEEIKKQNPEECEHKEELSCDGDGAEEYFSIEDKVKKYVQPGHNWFPRVTRIEKLTNLKLEMGWLEAKTKVFDPTRCDLKFHGTTAEACINIIRSGFKLPSGKGQMFGPGIYFASDSSKSAQELYTKGSKMLLVCEVLLGKAKTVGQACKCKWMTQKKLTDEGYDSLFAKRGTKETGGVLYDEFVVFNPKQAIPRYIVHYEKMDCTGLINNIDKALMPGGQKMVTHNILPPKRARSFDAMEMHFCLAESQFSRLMMRRKMHYEVQSVDLYLNPALMTKFEMMQAKLEAKYPGGNEHKPVLAFHGTRVKNITPIVEDNFDLSKLATNTGNQGAYGAGIYFSEFPEVSIGYGNTGKLLLCKVLPGKSYDCPTTMLGQALQSGYDSHRVRADTEGRGHELVIFDIDQILPCYVINYRPIFAP